MIRNLLISSFRFYKKYFSFFLGERCRFYPSCSEYAAQAVQKYGALKGLLLTIKRITKCHPWSGAGGVDEVP